MTKHTLTELQGASSDFLNRVAAVTVMEWKYNRISFLRVWYDIKGDSTGYTDTETDPFYFNPAEGLIYTEMLVVNLRQLHLFGNYKSILTKLTNSTTEENPLAYYRAETIAAILAVEGAE
jgi:hypothetical protein